MLAWAELDYTKSGWSFRVFISTIPPDLQNIGNFFLGATWEIFTLLYGNNIKISLTIWKHICKEIYEHIWKPLCKHIKNQSLKNLKCESISVNIDVNMYGYIQVFDTKWILLQRIKSYQTIILWIPFKIDYKKRNSKSQISYLNCFKTRIPKWIRFFTMDTKVLMLMFLFAYL